MHLIPFFIQRPEIRIKHNHNVKEETEEIKADKETF
jgi:hypothetical protein